MADDFLFYEEDYEEISDWDEESDAANNETTTTKHVSNSRNNEASKLSSKNNDGSEEKKDDKSSPSKTQITSSSKLIASRCPKSSALPYIARTASSSFICHKYSIFTPKEIKDHIFNMTKEVAMALNIDSEIVSLFLRRFGWKAERFMIEYESESTKCLSSYHLNTVNEKITSWRWTEAILFFI